MVLFVLGIVLKIDVEIKIAKISVDLLMLLVRLKDKDALLEQMVNAQESKIVNKPLSEQPVLKE